ncbi:DUF1002 domain-containing protein [Bacillus sp. WMMC1349]|uniref:DUF1002 domain-containing protein n=1 Tax=Bacillus sp. WMMC1349 TaxID=2736254 RepID=UPI0015582570|nr:DUF1002 domain-containing protein [Bacillus sp. WMMC1349]NPC93133.1 DUF1002 domain-containing protein [Bacillus sp. WMMC1349]
MKKTLFGILTALCLFIFPQISYADAAVGDVIITLGKDLSSQQKQKILDELNPPQNATTIEVTNAEEHKYLGSYIPKAQIGTRALSSSSITIAEQGTGLEVQTNHITGITDEMYLNALMTAGVKDAKIHVTAPFNVSGTAALTGLMKAYETTSDQAIPEDVKKVANKELVTTSELGKDIGKENAAALVAKVKQDIAKNGVPETQEELKNMINQAASDLNVTLTEKQMQSLLSLFDKMKNIDINWNQVGDQLDKAKDKISNFLHSEEAKNFFQKLIEFFVAIWNAIVSFFTGG